MERPLILAAALLLLAGCAGGEAVNGERLDGLDRRLDSLEEALKRLKQRLGSLEREVRSVKEERAAQTRTRPNRDLRRPAAVDPAALRPGLLAEFYAVPDEQPAKLNFTRQERLAARLDFGVDFDWGGGPPLLTDAVGMEFFAVQWSGYLLVPADGIYALETMTDDGVRLFVGGRKVIDDWEMQAPTINRVELSLAAGAHALRLEYFEARGGAVCRLLWCPPGGEAAVPIPGENLRHRPGERPPPPPDEDTL